jgi:hypothetical protein
MTNANLDESLRAATAAAQALDHSMKVAVNAPDKTPDQKVSIVSKPSKPSEVGNLIYGVLRRFIGASRDYLMLLVVWLLHTWTYRLLVTTPRLLVTSILPSSGKSTLMDWLYHLCYQPIAMSSVSSPALLSRAAADGGTLLIDEADRTLRKDSPYTADLLAISNSGYKDGGARPTLEPTKGGGWERVDLSTWCPVAYAGNNPELPDDTYSRCITVFLYPSDDVADTDWDLIRNGDPDTTPPTPPDADYLALSDAIQEWERTCTPMLRHRPRLDPSIKGRAREKWQPLARVAATLADLTTDDGEHISWLDTITRMALDDVRQQADDAALGLRNNSPHTAIVTDIARLWAAQWPEREFIGSTHMCSSLAASNPESWGSSSSFGTPITPRRLATMLKKVGVDATRDRKQTQRGYYFSAFRQAWDTLHVWESLAKEGINPPNPIDGSDALDTIDTSRKGYEDEPLDF